MADKLDILPDRLNSLAELSDLANVDDEDVESAIADWENDPPDDEFRELLRSEVNS